MALSLRAVAVRLKTEDLTLSVDIRILARMTGHERDPYKSVKNIDADAESAKYWENRQSELKNKLNKYIPTDEEDGTCWSHLHRNDKRAYINCRKRYLFNTISPKAEEWKRALHGKSGTLSRVFLMGKYCGDTTKNMSDYLECLKGRGAYLADQLEQ